MTKSQTLKCLAEKTGLESGVGYSRADADNDNQWRSWRVGLSLVHRFD